MIDPYQTVRHAHQRLLSRTGAVLPPACGSVLFSGQSEPVPSRNRYGAAAGSALAAYASLVDAIQFMQTGKAQEVGIDLERAVRQGLRSVYVTTQNGYTAPTGFTSTGQAPRTANFYRTRDGRLFYVLRIEDFPRIATALTGVLRCPNEAEAIAQAVAQWDAHELEEAFAFNGAFGVMVRTPAEWLQHPQGQWLDARPGFEIRKIGESQPMPVVGGEQPLEGLRVLDVSHVIAGPTVGKLLAQHGAQVLRVSAPHQADPQPYILDTGFGKRSAFLDLNAVEDIKQLKDLAHSADVFVESWRPGAMARRKFGPDDLAALRPGIVYVSLNCYGYEGPWAKRGGYEPIGQVATGLSAIEGGAETPRNAPTVTMNDYLAAFLAAAGAAGALLRRSTEGGSYHVTTSLAQASMWVLQQGQQPGQPPLPGPDAFHVENAWLDTMESAFGKLVYPTPVAQFSRMPARWSRPPAPLGSSVPEWNA